MNDTVTPKEVSVGSIVVWHEPNGRAVNALVTAVWSQTCVNLVIVSPDEAKKDDYGRQVERRTSCMHKGLSTVHGMYWRYLSEDANPYVPPQQV